MVWFTSTVRTLILRTVAFCGAAVPLLAAGLCARLFADGYAPYVEPSLLLRFWCFALVETSPVLLGFAFCAAALYTVSEMQTEGAWRWMPAVGASRKRLFGPFVVTGLLVGLAAGGLSVEVSPRAKHALRHIWHGLDSHRTVRPDDGSIHRRVSGMWVWNHPAAAGSGGIGLGYVDSGSSPATVAFVDHFGRTANSDEWLLEGVRCVSATHGPDVSWTSIDAVHIPPAMLTSRAPRGRPSELTLRRLLERIRTGDRAKSAGYEIWQRVVTTLLPLVLVGGLVGAALGSKISTKPLVTALVTWFAFYAATRLGDRAFAHGDLGPFAAALLPLTIALLLGGLSNRLWRSSP